MMEQGKQTAQEPGEKKILLTKENLPKNSGNSPRMLVAVAVFFLLTMLVILLLFLLLFWIVDKAQDKSMPLSPLFWGFGIIAGITLLGLARWDLKRLRLVTAIRAGDFYISIEKVSDKYVLSSSPGSPGKKFMLVFLFHDTGDKKTLSVSEECYWKPEAAIGAPYYFVRNGDGKPIAVPFPVCQYELDEELKGFLRNAEEL